MTRTTISSTRVKPFFVFQFFEHLVFLQLFVFVPTLQDLIGISYRHFITQFVFFVKPKRAVKTRFVFFCYSLA